MSFVVNRRRFRWFFTTCLTDQRQRILEHDTKEMDDNKLLFQEGENVKCRAEQSGREKKLRAIDFAA